jgi:hypothetical protein
MKISTQPLRGMIVMDKIAVTEALIDLAEVMDKHTISIGTRGDDVLQVSVGGEVVSETQLVDSKKAMKDAIHWLRQVKGATQ